MRVEGPPRPAGGVSAGASRLQKVTHGLTGSERQRAQQQRAGSWQPREGPLAGGQTTMSPVLSPPGPDSLYTGLSPAAQHCVGLQEYPDWLLVSQME